MEKYGGFKVKYLPNHGESRGNDAIRKAEFERFLETRNNELITAKKMLKGSISEYDPLFLFKWNDAGLQARIPTAATAGLRTEAGSIVATVADMKDAIAALFALPPDPAPDLGGHHDFFQFLLGTHYGRKLNMIMQRHTYLRKKGQGFVEAPADAANWPDIVEYCQMIAIVKGKKAFGPTNMLHLFNI